MVTGLRSSEVDAFYKRNIERVVRACALIALRRDAAEDLAAEAFTKLWSHWDRIESFDHAGGYVFKTAIRLSRRHERRESRLEQWSEREGTTAPRRNPDWRFGRLSRRFRSSSAPL